jgi:hypothetical protein
MKSLQIIITPICCIAFASCSSITAVSDTVELGITRVVADPRSYHAKNENVNITIDTENKIDKNAAGFAIPAVAASYLAGEMIKGAENASKNFSISYSGNQLGYPINQFSGFTVTRTVGKNDATASKLTFSVKNFHDSGYHYIALDSASITQSKAATPWWERDIDMVIAIKVSAPSGGKNGGPVVIDADQIVVKNIPLGGKVIETFKGSPHTGLFKLPESKTPFFLQVTVQELSDFTKVAEKGNTLVGENKKDWQKKIEELLSEEK